MVRLSRLREGGDRGASHHHRQAEKQASTGSDTRTGTGNETGGEACTGNDTGTGTSATATQFDL